MRIVPATRSFVAAGSARAGRSSWPLWRPLLRPLLRRSHFGLASQLGEVRRMTLGTDLNYGLSSNLTLDATINHDFGQVEADPGVINLGAFEQLFEARRPFFLIKASYWFSM